MVARRLTTLRFNLGGERFEATLHDGRLPSGVDITLIDIPGWFDRPGIYGDGDGDYFDNNIRFAVFNRAVLELLLSRVRAGTPFNIAHLHDWPAALTALYGKRLGVQDLDECTKFVLTLHSLAFQGLSDASMIDRLGIGRDLFHPDGVEFYGKINTLKAGIRFADALTTVSETYAREIMTSTQGRGLEGLLSVYRGKLSGIVNGIDYSVWNPAIDPYLPSRFDGQDLTNKKRCKAELLHEVGLAMRNDRPLLAFVGRLIDQKGVDILLDAMPEIMRSDVGVVIAGDGSGEYVDGFERAAKKWVGDIAFVQRPSDPLVHRVFAGSDILLVPSRYEPCGVVQRYAQRYGTVPVGHATGGLKDTIVDCDCALESGSGFLFDDASVFGLVSGVQRAVAAYATKAWPRLVKRVMGLDLGWDRSAHRYVEIYRSLLR